MTTATSGVRSFLQFARDLSMATSRNEVASLAEDYFCRYIGPCVVDFVLTNSPRASQLQHLLTDPEREAAVCAVEFECKLQIVAPLKHRDAVRAWYIIDFEAGPELSDAERNLVELVAFTSAGDLARLANSRNFDEHINDLNFMRRLEHEISMAHDVQSIGQMIKSELSAAISCTFIALLTAGDDPSTLEVVAYRGIDEANRVGYLVPIQGSKAGSVYASGTALLADNVLEDDSAYGRIDADWRSLIVVPLISGQQTFGALMVGHQMPSMYGERDLRIVEIAASHIAIGLYRLVEEERQQSQYRAAVEALSAAVDARDPYTHTHSRRVSELAGRLAAKLGLSEREAEQVRLAGLLHDIGKIGIPDRVLTKPGRLDAEERLIMMSHSEMGAGIVDSSPSLRNLTSMVRHHHEWFDGRGYPDGLRGDEIPVEAMILGIADALETMTSNRIYRSALTIDKAREELVAGRGSQFHPDMVDAMLTLIEFDPVVRQMVSEESGEPQKITSLSPLRISDVVDLRVLTRIASEIGTLTEIDTFLDHVHKIVREELDLADVVIWLFDEDSGTFRLVAGETDMLAPEKLEQSASVIQGSHLTSNTAMLLGRDPSSGIADRTAIFPMYVEDSLIGLIELVLRQPGQIDGRDVDLLQAIAAPVASTVRVAQLHDAAKRAATIDGLTGVLNHRAFYNELDVHMNELRDGDAISLLIVDVIGLKAINDNYGHLTGDSVLKTIAATLVSRLRDHDIVARYGGDEFAAILRGSLDAPIERIVRRLEEPVPCEVEDGTILNVRLRCGSARSVDGDTRAAELVARADSLLYRRIQPTSRNS